MSRQLSIIRPALSSGHHSCILCPAAPISRCMPSHITPVEPNPGSTALPGSLVPRATCTKTSHYLLLTYGYGQVPSNSSRVPLPCHSINSARRRSYKSETHVMPVKPNSACPVRPRRSRDRCRRHLCDSDSIPNSYVEST